MNEATNYEFECTNCSPTWYTEQPNYLDMAYPGNEEALQQYDDVLFAYCTHCKCVTEFPQSIKSLYRLKKRYGLVLKYKESI